jgi:alpha-glucosidase
VTQELKWWQKGVIYQIYPRSFMDASGNGVGDLQGILDRIDYAAALGVDAIWISPIYPSPMVDFGYDVADYTDIHPLFGDLATFDRLLAGAHARGLKVILDYVPNHTSDQHPWFQEARASRDNPRRDWYLWRDAKPDGSPPNNWESHFGGSAWEWDAATGQYYLHLFLKEQPDLNWRNPDVRAAMHAALRFWLDRGVDGFRMDVAPFLMKHPDMPDNPPLLQRGYDFPSANTLLHVYDVNQPEIHDRFREFRALFDSYPGDRVTIGETPTMDYGLLASFYGANNDGLHMPFNFTIQHRPWDVHVMAEAITAYYAALPAWATPNFVLGSHDVPRLATRLGYANHRSAAMLLLTLRGVPTLYYGDEIGMQNVDIPRELWQDSWALNEPDANIGRDGERTPMQWDDSPNAGFCPPAVTPWLPLAEDYPEVNVAAQEQEPESTLTFYRRLLALRRELPALHAGDIAFVNDLSEGLLAYTRRAGTSRVLVVINFTDALRVVDVPVRGMASELLLSTHFTEAKALDLGALVLRANESMLIRLS